jgi:benzyl alcohol O-benzoyltransferase
MVTFTARWLETEVVAPAQATRRELKYLSDIDNQRGLRFYATLVEFFRGEPADTPPPRRDLVLAIRSALADAFGHFYPIAGRLRELPPDGRLVMNGVQGRGRCVH